MMLGAADRKLGVRELTTALIKTFFIARAAAYWTHVLGTRGGSCSGTWSRVSWVRL